MLIGKIFIGGLAPHTTNESMKNLFQSTYGPVADCKVMTTTDKGTGMTKSRGFGFLKFEDPATVDAVFGGPKGSTPDQVLSDLL